MKSYDNYPAGAKFDTYLDEDPFDDLTDEEKQIMIEAENDRKLEKWINEQEMKKYDRG